MFGKLTKEQLIDKATMLCAIDVCKDTPDVYECTNDCSTCGYAKQILKEANNAKNIKRQSI